MQWVWDLHNTFDSWIDSLDNQLDFGNEVRMMNDGVQDVVAEMDGVEHVAAEMEGVQDVVAVMEGVEDVAAVMEEFQDVAV
jgi:hypothetical protein